MTKKRDNNVGRRKTQKLGTNNDGFIQCVIMVWLSIIYTFKLGVLMLGELNTMREKVDVRTRVETLYLPSLSMPQ